MVGSVSGGCVESDVFEHALRVLETNRPVLVRYAAGDELGLTVGLSCGGSIEVLIEPFVEAEAWQALCRALDQGDPGALCVAIAPAGLMCRQLAVFGNGASIGSIDASIDDHIVAEARPLMVQGGTCVLNLPFRNETLRVFVEALPRPQSLFIVGATHTAIPLSRVAKALGFRVSVIDARGVYVTPERFPNADALLRVSPDEGLAGVRADAAAVVILTHDPKFDLPALTSALRSGFRYIGLLGSRRTCERRRAALRDLGFGPADIARIRGPIGLDIGARTPEEIALAILAEVLAVFRGRTGRSLSEQTPPSNGLA
jgi:xanthine dehydrogenase accessory factor